MIRRTRALILGYHGVGTIDHAHDPHNLIVSPSRFRAQVQVLLDAGFTFVTVSDIISRLLADGRPPPGVVALSFDDGMEDNYSVLFPILQELSLTATVYVTTGLIGRPNPWLLPEAGARMMTADELRALHSAGVELGAHTVSHRDMSQLDHDACLAEVQGSIDALSTVTAASVHTFAYPYGRYGEDALRALRSTSIIGAVTCEHRGSWAPLELKRPMITGKDRLPDFLLKATGTYYPLYTSAPGRHARRLTRAWRSRRRRRAASTLSPP